MNLKEIREMINLMNENNLNEIEIEREGTKIKLKKSSLESEFLKNQPPEIQVSSSRIPAEPVNDQAASPSSTSSESSSNITSPMVGTFYRAPSPESPPFIEVGQIVEVGQVVCIVEAMKLMNEIKSEVRGKVTEVLVENAEPVEFGQTLYVIGPA